MKLQYIGRLRNPRWWGIIARRVWGNSDDGVFDHARGIIHVGANTGQEREWYDQHGLDVVWIEPIPEVCARLRDNLRRYPDQRALEYLITDRDGREHQFNIANNDGESSSIFDLDQHKDIWPDVSYTRSITMTGITLASLVEREGIDMTRYNVLAMDTQGSELLVLKGARPILKHFDCVLTEAADFEIYKGCALLDEIDTLLREEGFCEKSKKRFAIHPNGGSCYNVVYERVRRRSDAPADHICNAAD
jgi:FkbM family methyltransferase